MDILGTSSRSDASLILARQLIAAKLNLAAGRAPDAIASTILSADSKLAGYPGKLPYAVPPSSTAGRAMTSDADVLERYNTGLLTPICSPLPTASPAPEPGGFLGALLRWVGLVFR